MPIGRKLDIQGPIVLDFKFINDLLVQHGTLCETPACHTRPGGPQPAWSYYQTMWSFIWICQSCHIKTQILGGAAKNRYDRTLAEHMYELFLVRSYVHQNVKSGFLLEELIEQRDDAVKQIAKIEKAQPAAERRELRAAIRDSAVKIGAPDDDLLVARQRQDLRVAMGKPTLGRVAIDRTAPLRSKLLVPTIFVPPIQNQKEGE